MPDLPFDPPQDAPHRGQAIVVSDDTDKAARRCTHRDIIAMYPVIRLDHLRYLEKCGFMSPATVDRERYYGFADLSLLRQIASELQQGTPFRAVVRNLQNSQTGQLAFDFRLDAHPARIIELKPRRTPSLSSQAAGTQGTIPLGTPGTLGTIGTGAFGAISSAEQYFLMGSLLDELAEAQALYERAILLDPSYFEAHFNLGNIHHDHGQYAAAERSYLEALALNPEYADAHFYLAVTLEKMGRSIEARVHWKAYERLAPQGEWVELAKEFSD